MSAEIERDRATAARASSWTLWFLSLVSMGATFAGTERQEMRAALEQAELLELAEPHVSSIVNGKERVNG